jgi:hypothetical protein
MYKFDKIQLFEEFAANSLYLIHHLDVSRRKCAISFYGASVLRFSFTHFVAFSVMRQLAFAGLWKDIAGMKHMEITK